MVMIDADWKSQFVARTTVIMLDAFVSMLSCLMVDTCKSLLLTFL